MRFSKLIMFATLIMVGLSATAAQAQKVKWKTIVGIIDQNNRVGVGVGQVRGAGQPWSIRSGSAEVNLETGDLRFKVRGLVLAGGAGEGGRGPIGTNPAAEVIGTLVCDSNGSEGDSILVDTDPVPMSAQGNASIKTNLSPLPSECVDESDITFLIRVGEGPDGSVSPPRWIANGAVRTRKSEK